MHSRENLLVRGDQFVGRVSAPLSKAGQRPALLCLVSLFLLPATVLLVGCGGVGMGMPGLPGMGGIAMGRGGAMASGGDQAGGERFGMPDVDAMAAKSQLMQDLMNNPDLPVWHDQRQKLAMAVGDRVFDKSFDEVFDGMTVALATLGARVNNIDRSSGYITAFIPDLGPEQTESLARSALAEYAQAKGYPATVLQKHSAWDIDPTMGANMASRMGGSGLTLTMVRQTPTQTKVKLRFDNVYYPQTVQELYRVVWIAVDKQMFLDRSLDH
jgi:hypothetical protein